MHDGHLTEEELVEIATGDASGPQLKHLEICRECSQAITELQIVKSALSSIDDQEIPRKTEREILLLSQKSKWEGVQQLLLNPMLTAFIVIIMLVLIYYSVITFVL